MSRRESFLTLASRSFWMWFGGIWLLMGILFLVATVWVAGSLQAIQRSGEMAEGVVREKRLDKQALLPHTVRYRFPTPDGQTFEDDGALPKEQWDALRDGGPVRVRYDRTHPFFHQLEGERQTPIIIAGFIVFGVCISLVGGALIVHRLVQIGQALHLQQEGVIAEATVLDVRPVGIPVNNERLCVIRYRFRDYQGTDREGQSIPMAAAEALRWRPGDRGTVRFDRRQSARNAWVGARWGEA